MKLTTMRWAGFATFAFFAVTCAMVLNVAFDGDVVHESMPTTSSFSMEAASELARKHVQGKGNVLGNIAALKAYSLAAHWKARHVLNNPFSRTSRNSLLPFIVAYGAQRGGNPVAEYADVMSKMRLRYPTGLSRYTLLHLNQAILRGKGVVRPNYPPFWATLDAKALGLVSAPHLLYKLGVTFTKYGVERHKVLKQLQGADAKAAAKWLLKGAKGKYKSFYSRLKGHWQLVKDKKRRKAVKTAVRAERNAFGAARERTRNTFTHVAVQTPASKKSTQASYTPPLTVPSDKQLRINARNTAKAWMRAQAKRLRGVSRRKETKQVVKDIMHSREGVTVKMTTSLNRHSESAQAPRIVIVGATGRITGRITGLPGRGRTLKQLFSSKPIGHVKYVYLTASSRDGWGCHKLSVKSGNSGSFETMEINGRKGFTLKSSGAKHIRLTNRARRLGRRAKEMATAEAANLVEEPTEPTVDTNEQE